MNENINIPNLKDFANYRYNVFTDTFTPKLIGTAPNSPELHTIPSVPPYIIELFEAPQNNSPTTTIIYDINQGFNLTEVAFSDTPGINEFRVNYGLDKIGSIEFHPDLAGHDLECNYNGLGAISFLKTLITLRTKEPKEITVFPYSILPLESHLICFNGLNDVTITLPDTNIVYTGWFYYIKRLGLGRVTIQVFDIVNDTIDVDYISFDVPKTKDSIAITKTGLNKWIIF